MSESEDPPFKGLKVVDAGSWIAGPVASTILADYGADVTKVEMPGGDPFRRLAAGPGTPNADINYAWAQDARNKRSITIDLKRSDGIEILHRLVRQCDVYVTNYPLPMRRRLNLTYEDLKPMNPSMIYASLTAYGEKGPERDREGFDLVAYWSRSGLMDLVRNPDGIPAHSIPGMGDHPTAVTLYASIVTALLRRERTGEGSMVHTSLVANGVWAASCIAGARFAHGSDFSNYPRLTARYFTRELYETLDGRWLQFTMVRTEDEIRVFLRTLQCEYLLDDARFASTRARIESGSALAQELRPLIKERSANEWLETFKSTGIPVSIVGTIADLDSDPQLRPNHILVDPPGDVGAYFLINHPVNVDGINRADVQRAPDVGEHTTEVLTELGYDDSQIQDLRSEGVV